MESACIVGCISLLIVFLIVNYELNERHKREKIRDDKNWEEIWERNKQIRIKRAEIISSLPPKTKIWAKRSDYHNWEEAEIIKYDGCYVFFEYFDVKFKDEHEQKIGYFHIKKQ